MIFPEDGIWVPPPATEPFPCTSCGACCMDIRHVPDLKELIGKDGRSCMHLKGKRCSIYEERPMACRIDDLKPPTLGWETWHLLNRNACDYLHQMRFGCPRETKGECDHEERK